MLLRVISIILLLSAGYNAYSQGCSDAGVCSIDGHSQKNFEEDTKFRIMLQNSAGIGDESVFINSTSIGLKYRTSYGLGATVMMPFTFTSGDLGSYSNFGDLTMLLDYEIYRKDDYAHSLVVGGKLASSGANNNNYEDGRPLPMVYQSSNGTDDLIALYAVSFGEWAVSLGYQHVLNDTENSFLPTATSTDDEYSDLILTYQPSNLMRRGNDVMLKVEKYFLTDSDWKFKGGILPVYRLQETEYENAEGERVSLEGSDGLTFNVIGGAYYKLNYKHDLKFEVGFPLATRETRADGLTRAFVFNIGFDVKF